MSTRANIFIRDNYDDRDKEIVYHHCDGYPEGVGITLSRILRKLSKDETQKLTKLSLAKFICDNDPDFKITTPYSAGDAEYVYEINLAKLRVDYEHLYTGEQEWLCNF